MTPIYERGVRTLCFEPMRFSIGPRRDEMRSRASQGRLTRSPNRLCWSIDEPDRKLRAYIRSECFDAWRALDAAAIPRPRTRGIVMKAVQRLGTQGRGAIVGSKRIRTVLRCGCPDAQRSNRSARRLLCGLIRQQRAFDRLYPMRRQRVRDELSRQLHRPSTSPITSVLRYRPAGCTGFTIFARPLQWLSSATARLQKPSAGCGQSRNCPGVGLYGTSEHCP